MKKLIIIALVLAAVASTQTAKVTILTASDSKDAFEAYQAMQKAEKHWSAVRARIKREYGVESDIEFAVNFKAFVDKGTTGTAPLATMGTGEAVCWNLETGIMGSCSEPYFVQPPSKSFGAVIDRMPLSGQKSDHPPHNYQDDQRLIYSPNPLPCSADDHRPLSERLTNCVAW